jgi:hypothetical protein
MCRVYLGVLPLALLLIAGAVFGQQSGPMTLQDVREAIDTLPDARVRVFVNQRKVDFDLTPDLENEFRKKGVSQDTLDLIRIKRVIPKATLDVGCKPVDCEVYVNDTRLGDVRLGMTTQGRLKKTDQDPARVTVTVKATGFKEQSTVLQMVANSTSTYDFTLERMPLPPPPRVDPPPRPDPAPAPAPTPAADSTPAPTPNPTPTPAPAPAQPAARGEAPAPRVDPAPPRGSAPAAAVAVPDAGPQQLLNRMIEACGGIAALKGLTRYSATGDLTLVDNSGARQDAQLKESVIYPKSIKWELRVAGAVWNVTSGPDETWSDGDVKFKGSSFGQELERNIKIFVSMHIGELLSRFQEKDVKLTLAPPAGDQPILVAQTSDDRYTITIDTAGHPAKIVHEALTGLQPKFEMLYGRYEMQGKLALPGSMTLRYPNQPNYGHEVRYTRTDTAAQPKESDFRRRGFLGVLPAK